MFLTKKVCKLNASKKAGELEPDESEVGESEDDGSEACESEESELITQGELETTNLVELKESLKPKLINKIAC